MLVFLTLTALFGAAQLVAGWGADTHPTIGYLAERFLRNETAAFITNIFAGEPQWHGSIGSAANWADRQGRNNENRGWHFVDAQDDPPSNCSVKYDRDCPPKGGCVISAIRNQTKILEHCYQNGDTSEECAQALKYVVHFFGDITQPLHCSEKSLGGNQIFVKFDGLRRNLHECWDTEIPIKLVRTNIDPPTFPAWTDSLERRITSSPHSFLSEPEEWIKCIGKKSMEDCAIIWATESNTYTCSFVYETDVTAHDLGGPYFEGAVPIVETQVAKAGLRLAVYLNMLVTSRPGWSDDVSDIEFTVENGEGVRQIDFQI